MAEKSYTQQASEMATNAYNSAAETLSSATTADSGRKDLSTKAGEKATPDNSKSYVDQAKEAVTGAYDKVARDVVPDSEKSTGQSLTDKTSRVKDDIKN